MNVNKTKFLGAMIFVTILMDVVPYVGFLKVGNISFTTMHIPPILTSIVLGPISGTLLGLLFGVISLMRAVSRESAVLDALLQNPLISILPRVLFPLITGHLYLFLSDCFRGRLESLSVALSAAVGSLLNSIMVLGFLYLIYHQQFLTVLNVSETSQVLPVILRAFGPCLLVETFLCILVCVTSVRALRKRSLKKP